MQTRRSFFRRFSGAVATVLVAPQFIARFMKPTVVPTVFTLPVPANISDFERWNVDDKISPFWLETSRWSRFEASSAYRKALWKMHYRELRVMARDGDTPLDTLLQAHYIGVRERQSSERKFIESFMLGHSLKQEETF